MGVFGGRDGAAGGVGRGGLIDVRSLLGPGEELDFIADTAQRVVGLTPSRLLLCEKGAPGSYSVARKSSVSVVEVMDHGSESFVTLHFGAGENRTITVPKELEKEFVGKLTI